MKVPLKLPIEAGKTYYTEAGSEVRIFDTECENGLPGKVKRNDGWYAHAWSKEGKSFSRGDKITHEEWRPQDKELVWGWDEYMTFGKYLGFYDAKNDSIFNIDTGRRSKIKFRYCAPYEGEWPDWAKEAYKKLED